MNLSVIDTIVRGMILDRTEDGIVTKFSESDLINAVNSVKNEMYGIRPEAFCTTDISVEPPSDLSSSRYGLEFTLGDTVVVMDELHLAIVSSAATGTVRLSFRTDSDGALFLIGDGASNYLSATLESGDIVVRASDADGVTTASVTLEGGYIDDRWYNLEVSADGSALTVAVDNDSEETDYAGNLLPSTANGYLGFSDVVSDAWFAGAMADFQIENAAGTDLFALAMNDTSGTDVTESVGGYNAQISGPEYEWLEDESVPIAPWAERRFCYGVAAFLLRQAGKDSFYRKAAADLEALYTGAR